MKYVVFTRNSDHYFDKMLFCTNNREDAESFCEDFWNIVAKYSKIVENKHRWIHSRYRMNNFDNSTYSEVVDMWWAEVVKSTREEWLSENCSENFILTCEKVSVDLFTLVDDQYYVDFEPCSDIGELI